jgi:putative ABC transport system permease protein
MQRVPHDLRYAFRQILRTPSFSLTAIFSLALGIGATVSVFSVIYSAILTPWPYAGFDRVCQLNTINRNGAEGEAEFTGPQIRELRQASASEDVVAVDSWSLTLTGSEAPEDVKGVYLSGNGFLFFGMPTMLGRYFEPSDAPDAGDPQPVVVLSYKFWQRHFAGDPSIVGKSIQLERKTYAVLGVMPIRFTWGDGDVYLPLKMPHDQGHVYETFIKLKPGVGLEAAEAEFRPMMQRFDKERPNFYPANFRIAMRKMGAFYTRDLRVTLYFLFGSVSLLLLIGCSNVSILLLARGTTRYHELAIRSALGASRFQIVLQLLTESLLLALLGAGIGVLLAYRALDFIVARLPEYSFPHEADFHVNVPVLLFSVGLAAISGVLFGVFPALDSARRNINQSIQSGTHKLTGNLRRHRVYTGLIAGQIALTLLLLTGAGAAIQGFSRMIRRPLGYEPHHVMSVGIPIHENTFTTWPERASYIAQLRDRVAETPGVLAAGISSNATPPRSGWNLPFELLGKNAMEQQEARVHFVSSEYFSMLQIPLIEGRLWQQSEIARGAPLAVVNQAFARRYFSGEDGLNHSLRVPRLGEPSPYRLVSTDAAGWLQIIGVTADALDDGLDKPILPAVYLPYTNCMFMGTQILVRAEGDPLRLLGTIRRSIATLNPDQQASADVRDLEGWIMREPEFANGRLVSILFGTFSALALGLAAVGLFSVVSYSVAQRTGEFGIRMALGAQRKDVLRIVLWSAATSVGIGLGAGLLLSLGSGKVIARWVQNGSHDPLIALGVSLLVIFVAGLACVVPAWRALGVDPNTALRCE